jgi:hypothetical protein
MVIAQNHEKMNKEFEEMLIDEKYENSREFLEEFIKKFARIIENNFEAVDLAAQDRDEDLKHVMGNLIPRLGKYLKKNLPDSEIDHATFALTIFSFIYVINIEKNRGYTFSNYETCMQRFIDNTIKCTV